MCFIIISIYIYDGGIVGVVDTCVGVDICVAVDRSNIEISFDGVSFSTMIIKNKIK